MLPRPRLQHIVETSLRVADVDTIVVEVEPERGPVPVSQHQAGVRLGRVGEANGVIEPHGTVLGGDVTEHSARTDGGELLVVAEQLDHRTHLDGVVDHGGEGEGVGHARLVDDQQRPRANRRHQLRVGLVLQVVNLLGQGVASHPRRIGQRGSCCR